MNRQSYYLKSNALSSALLLFAVVMLLVCILSPGIQQPASYHDFADQRTLLGIPHAMDVLSNLPFLLVGILACLRTRRLDDHQWQPLLLTLGVGMILTFLGSSYYHLTPNNSGLLWDRLGMAVAFAGVLSLAIADRVSLNAAWRSLFLSTAWGLLSLWIWWTYDNLLPWAMLQGAGSLLLLGLAVCRPVSKGYALGLGWCVLWYGLAKVCELSDQSIFELSGGMLSGHSIKHLFAALAVMPLLPRQSIETSALH